MNRDIQKEIQYFVYNDPEYGEDMENISYPALFKLLGELLDRVEKLEQRLDRNDRWKRGLAKVANEVNNNVQESVVNVQESVSNVLKINEELQENLSNLREINSRM